MTTTPSDHAKTIDTYVNSHTIRDTYPLPSLQPDQQSQRCSGFYQIWHTMGIQQHSHPQWRSMESGLHHSQRPLQTHSHVLWPQQLPCHLPMIHEQLAHLLPWHCFRHRTHQKSSSKDERTWVRVHKTHGQLSATATIATTVPSHHVISQPSDQLCETPGAVSAPITIIFTQLGKLQVQAKPNTQTHICATSNNTIHHLSQAHSPICICHHLKLICPHKVLRYFKLYGTHMEFCPQNWNHRYISSNHSKNCKKHAGSLLHLQEHYMSQTRGWPFSPNPIASRSHHWCQMAWSPPHSQMTSTNISWELEVHRDGGLGEVGEVPQCNQGGHTRGEGCNREEWVRESPGRWVSGVLARVLGE